MRDIIIIIAIIVIIVTGDIVTSKYLSETADNLTVKLENLKQETKQAKDNENIKHKMDEIENEWDKTNSMWSMIAVHQELDNIEQAITKAKANIENNELTDALEEIETVIFYVEHVKTRERISLKNIL